MECTVQGEVLRQVLEATECLTKESEFYFTLNGSEEETNLIWPRLLENNVGNNLGQM